MVHKKREKGGSSASALFMQEAESSEDSPLKALPKAYERSEVKTAELVFRSAFASHQPLASVQGSGASVLKICRQAFCEKKRLYK